MDVRKLNVNMFEPEFYEVEDLRLAIFSTKGTRADGEKNEDSCGVVHFGGKQLALVVSDGLGGHKMGGRASKIVIGTTLGRKSKERRPLKAHQFYDKIEKSHKKISALGTNAGATLVAALLEDKSLRFYTVGDSSGFLISVEGDVKYRTLEHSVVGFATEAGVLGPKEARNHKESHIILNCLGFWDSRVEGSFEMEMISGDTVVLCSDGLTEVLTKKEIVSKLVGAKFQNGVLDLLSKAIKRRKGRDFFDDMTFVICQKK